MMKDNNKINYQLYQQYIYQELQMRVSPDEKRGSGAHRMNNNFMNSLPEANEIFDTGQHLKRNIYPFQMKSKGHVQQQWEQNKYDKSEGYCFKPVRQTVMQHFQTSAIVYDKFNNNSDEQLFNLNLYPMEKLRNLKNIDYITSVQPTQPVINFTPPYLMFDSRFQSGNLSLAAYSDQVYCLLLHNDVNTFGYTSWFYFQVKNRTPGKYRFAIMNYGKAGWMHNQGVKICVFSKMTGWTRDGSNIHCQNNRNLFSKGKFLNFNTLYFEYQFTEENSEVFFAYNVPYTYNDLCCFLDEIESPFFHRKLAGLSLAGNRLEMLTITNFQLQKQGADLPVIIIMARAHSGETVSSWVMHEILIFLLSDCAEAQLIRNNFVFKLFPMMNPDGVIHGNYRCSLSGRDLNRRWQEPNKDLFPQVYFIKNQIMEIYRKKHIKIILDLHGHTQRRNFFSYGCQDKNQPHKCRLFPYIVSKMTEYFDFRSCNFYMDKSKLGTARVTLFNLLRIPYVYTIETSQFGTANGHLSGKVFKQIGESLARGILALFKIRMPRISDKVSKILLMDGGKIENVGEEEIIEDQKQYFDISMQELEKQLQNDVSLMKIGNEKDDGSDSQPSADNIKFDRLAELNQRKCMRINTNIAKPPPRPYKSTVRSGSLHKVSVSDSNSRPKTGYSRNKNLQITLNFDVTKKNVNERSSSMNRRVLTKNYSDRGKKVEYSIDEKRRQKSYQWRKANINYIDYSLSINDQKKSSYISVPLNLRFENRELYNKLKSISRNYRKIK